MSKNAIPIFLTSLEEEILYALVMNFTKKHLADYFQLSEETIEKHIENIKVKIDKVESGDNYYLANR